MELRLKISLLKETETLVLPLHRTEFSPQSDEPQNGFYPRSSRQEHNPAETLNSACKTQSRESCHAHLTSDLQNYG